MPCSPQSVIIRVVVVVVVVVVITTPVWVIITGGGFILFRRDPGIYDEIFNPNTETLVQPRSEAIVKPHIQYSVENLGAFETFWVVPCIGFDDTGTASFEKTSRFL